MEKEERKEAEKTKNYNIDSTTLSPHTLRLFKLIASENAAPAISLLASIAKTCSTTQLWDILGRLQELLTSNRWKTRTNAALALQSVAKLLPPLQPSMEQCHYLTVQEIQEHLDTILSKGRLLLSHDKPDILNEDQPHTRMQQQRAILEQKLGLAGLAQVVTTHEEIISSHDIINEEPCSKKPKRVNGDDEIDPTVRRLLMKDPSTSQQLLSTELLYRIYHASWQQRHGALLGCLALKSWYSPTLSQDVLCRCLGVLCLERFGDFSNAAVVAPVREAAGQVVSVLWKAASAEIQKVTLDILFRLASEQEWEVRHGALIAVKFITALQQSHEPNEVASIAIEHLQDESDDVKSVAAQILQQLLRLDLDVQDAIMPLWTALQQAKSVSSCLMDLVTLLALIMERDCDTVVRRLESIAKADLSEIIQLVVRLLDSEYASVQLSAMQCAQSLATPIARACDLSQQLVVSSCATLVLSLFQSYFAPAPDTMEGSSEDGLIYQKERDKAWKELSQAERSVFQHAETEWSTLELSLLCIYFGVKTERSRTDDWFPCFVQASNALALLLSSTTASSLSSQVRVTLTSCLQSPWSFQCEAACLLIRSLSNSPFNQTIQDEFAETLQSLLVSNRPLCIKISAASDIKKALGNVTVAKICDEALLHGLSQHSSSSASYEHTVRSITDIWTKTVESRNVTWNGAPLPNVLSMRVDATIAGAIVAASLPPKLTPVIRALMTSLKNEAEPLVAGDSSIRDAVLSHSRLSQSCQYLSELLKSIESTPQFAGARLKVIDSMCEMITDESSCRQESSARVLQLLISQQSPRQRLLDMEPLWKRLKLLIANNERYVNEETVLPAVKLLTIACKGMLQTPHFGPRADEVRPFVVPLIQIACEHGEGSLHDACLSALQFACHIDRRVLLEQALICLSSYIHDNISDSLRVGACTLLESLVQDAGPAICPFVRSLLPLVMSLMTDPSEECAHSANKAFAALVRVSPLVKNRESVRLQADSGGGGESVIDHLIFGRPFPPCPLPKVIEQSLASNNIKLRSYQTEGVAWLHFLQSLNLSGALCDSMGLGKTLQALVAIALSHVSPSGHPEPDKLSLIVCPSSVVGHWTAEINKFFPNGTVFHPLSLTGSASERKLLWNSRKPSVNIVVTSYAVMRADIELLSQVDWQFCVLDEGHLLKNPKTATARASRRLRARHRLILTGTPIQNHVNELWATFDFLMPNFLGTHSAFSSEFARPITKSHLPGASAEAISEGLLKLKALHQQVLPFILRREKSQVLSELPPKIVSTISVPMTDLQSKLYNSLLQRKETKQSLSKLSAMRDDEQKPVPLDTLKSLLLLRLVCTHPALIFEENEPAPALSGKFMALLDLLRDAEIYEDEIMAADNDSSLLYIDSDEAADAVTFDSVVDSTEAGGMELQQAAGNKSKCIIFCQFTKTLDLVESILPRTLRLDGKVPAAERAQVAERFNTDPTIRILLSTTRVGGLGLNLTGADTVIFLENDFNPFADLQAQDRAHRIGQRSTVNIYNLVTQDSIEETIMELQRKKIAVSNAIVNSENSSLYSMGTDRLLDIFGNDDDTFDVDALVEEYREDYKSFGVQEFLKNIV